MKEKRIDIEIMRILAAFFVIFGHTEEWGFFLFSRYDSQSLQFWAYMFLCVFCFFVVPIFFMIAGALMLNREPASYRVFLKKVLRMGLILVFWSAVYYLIDVYNGSVKLSPKIFVTRMYTSEWCFAFWYLYTYIAFMLTVPVLQRIARSLTNKEYLYLFALVFLVSAVHPTAEYLIWNDHCYLNEHFDLGWISVTHFLYPLLGYFLMYRIPDFWNKKRLGILWMINILLILLSCWLTYHESIVTGVLEEGTSERFCDTFTGINCVAIFATCQYFVKNVKIRDRVKKVIVSLGGATFGMYLTHILIMRIFEKMHITDMIYGAAYINDMLRALLYSALVFAAAYFLTQILKKIPVLKYTVS